MTARNLAVMVFQKQSNFSVINLKGSIKQSTQLLTPKGSSLNSLLSIRTQSLFSFCFFITKGIRSILFFCSPISIRCVTHFKFEVSALQ